MSHNAGLVVAVDERERRVGKWSSPELQGSGDSEPIIDVGTNFLFQRTSSTTVSRVARASEILSFTSHYQRIRPANSPLKHTHVF